MEGRFHRLATPLVAGVVVLVAAAAVGASLADGGGRPGGAPAAAGTVTATTAATAVDSVIGAVLRLPRPAPGAFAGTLYWDAPDCSTGSLDLATGAAAAGLPARACSIYSAPGGGALAYTAQSRPGAARLSVLVRATGREHDGPVRGGSTAVSGDGHVATCGAQQVLEQAPDGATRTVPGCAPACAATGCCGSRRTRRRAVDDGGGTVIPPGNGTLRMLAADGDAIATLRATGGLGGEIEVWRAGRLLGHRTMGSAASPTTCASRPTGRRCWCACAGRRSGPCTGRSARLAGRDRPGGHPGGASPPTAATSPWWWRAAS